MSKDKWIKKFKEEAMPKIIMNFGPIKLIIFGSRVKGEAKDYSDIDVIMISESFRGVHFLKRMPLVVKTISFPKHIDFICYTPDEFERIANKSSLIIAALKEGMELNV